MRTILVGCFALLLMAAAPASAPAPKPASAPAVAVGAGTVATVPAPASAPATPAGIAVAPAAPASPAAEHVPTPSEVVKEAGQVVAAAGEYFSGTKGEAEAKKFGLLALIAAVLNLLISLLKLTGNFWSETRGKWILRLVSLSLGVVVFIVSSMALGMPWWDAVTLGLAGPGAVVMQEYKQLLPFLRKKPKK